MTKLLRPLRQPTYRRLFVGQGLSRLGDFVFMVALTWQVLEMTGSTVDLGLVLGLSGLAQVITLFASTAFVDRVSRRGLVVALDLAQAGLAAALATLSWSGALTMAELYGLALGFGACTAFSQPGLNAYLPDTVDRHDLQAANSLFQGVRNGAGIAGPALGAAVIALGVRVRSAV